MSWIKEEDMRAIRQQADIVDIMSNYLTLEKKGKNYRAICPFHDDHDPSLSISTDKQIFKCFVCGTGGNVFTFVQKIEEISFPEAVAKVAQMIGYPLEISTNGFEPKPNVNQPYYDVMNDYIAYTQYELNATTGMACLEYCHRRNINEDIIKRFQIGYAPAQEKSYHYLKAKKYSDEILLDTGLIREGNDGYTSTFFDRLMIPIHDENGNPVGFTARIITNKEGAPKYINTSQTKIYEKSNLVFNYHRAKDFARKKHRCILVEGAMDVIALEKADIHEGVACLGTACTTNQINLLKRLQVGIVVCYDGDRAGMDATYKFSKMACEHGLHFVIVNNRTKKDPDEIFEEQGKDGLEALISKTVSYVEFLFGYLLTKYNLDNYEDKKQYAEEIYEAIKKTCDEVESATYLSRIKTQTGFDFSALTHDQKPLERKHTSAPRSYTYLEAPLQGRLKAEQSCLAMMLLSKEAAMRFKDEIGFFKDDLCSKLSLYCYDMYRSKDRLDMDGLIASIDEEEVRNFFISLIGNSSLPGKYDEEYFQDCLIKIKECTLKEQIDLINQKIESMPSAMEKLKLASKKNELIVQKNALRRKDG